MSAKAKKAKPIDVERKERAEKLHRERLNAHPRKKRRKVTKWVDTLPRELPAAYRTSETKSLDTRAHHTYRKSDKKYSGEMAEREAMAQKELQRKQSRVAPLYNKGGLQYISDETNLHEVGKKL